jgi:hypothetical protein
METFVSHSNIHWAKIFSSSDKKDLFGEEPLSIRLQRKPYSVVTRPPAMRSSMLLDSA